MTRVTSPHACLQLTAILDEDGELPCNIKFIVEGEEETASVHLHDFVTENMEILKADACIWEFGGVDHRDVPMQYLGLRGICYVELSVELLGTDVHSGLGGSILPNAAWRLVWALTSLKGVDERILIPGFYDDVIPPSARDRELMGKLPDVADEYKTRYGVKEFIKGLERRNRSQDRRSVHAHLHHLRTHQRLSRSRLKDRAARARICQSGFPPRASSKA